MLIIAPFRKKAQQYKSKLGTKSILCNQTIFQSSFSFSFKDNKKISIELKEGIFMAVTNNIREIREQRGIYQDDLAAAIGYSAKTVGRIEHGDSTPSAEFMLRISKYFNMLVEDVFHAED
ncbi:DNA-binding helix-turn-helix protein [[Bacteroides] pectinophilus ATCC 43243]|uniref:HTH cro/C1-type domain-containing protein n=1 Tax=[Bacteroides] pectinophilus ATCC 43243 TaxID=483218 RepID=B7AWM6_9FIRM|nr:DNA-binding helix-turn-helix protein [[Bacteroides] pectinophilus ATCC 43243]